MDKWGVICGLIMDKYWINYGLIIYKLRLKYKIMDKLWINYALIMDKL